MLNGKWKGCFYHPRGKAYQSKKPVCFSTFGYKKYYKRGRDKLIRNYGLGAQILKNLKVNRMILVTKSRKKVIGLEGYNLSITKQEII